LCKRLRPRFPDGRLIVGRWGGIDDPAGEVDKFRSVGADEVTTSLADTHRNVSAWFPVVATQGGDETAEPSPLRPGKEVPGAAEPALQP
jgi:hypothetical protein